MAFLNKLNMSPALGRRQAQQIVQIFLVVAQIALLARKKLRPLTKDEEVNPRNILKPLKTLKTLKPV